MTGTAPAVSVIIPTYQRAHVIRRAIDSVLAQTFRDFELIIVDDGSTDLTADLVRNYRRNQTAGLSPEVIYLYQNRQNVASARNLGVARAQGDFIAFLDSDDSWHPEKLQRQVEYLRNSQVAFVHTGRVIFPSPGNRRSDILPYPQPLARNRRELLAGHANVAMTVLARREVLLRTGLFDESLATTQDLDLWLRIACDHEIGLLDEPLVNSYKLADSHMASNPPRTYRDRLTVMQRMTRERHADVITGNWCRLAASHALRLAQLRYRNRRYMSAGYWTLNAGWNLIRAKIHPGADRRPIASSVTTSPLTAAAAAPLAPVMKP